MKPTNPGGSSKKAVPKPKKNPTPVGGNTRKTNSLVRGERVYEDGSYTGPPRRHKTIVRATPRGKSQSA